MVLVISVIPRHVPTHSQNLDHFLEVWRRGLGRAAVHALPLAARRRAGRSAVRPVGEGRKEELKVGVSAKRESGQMGGEHGGNNFA